MDNNNITPEQEVIMNMYSIIYSVIQSEHTPMITKMATIQTLKQIIEREDSPFTKSDELMDMAVVLATETNNLIQKLVSKERAKEGESILSGIDFSDN